MNGICIRQEATIEQLQAVTLPEQTDSYMPVAHDWVVNYIENNVADMLGGQYTLKKNTFGLSWHDQCLFGQACFQNEDTYAGLNIAYRNSYNKEFSLGIAFGAQVFVCENGMLTGEVIVAKKHTLNVVESFEQVVSDNIGNAEKTYHSMIEDVHFMRGQQVNDLQAYQILGITRGQNILSPRVFETALKEYAKPSFEEHNDGSLMQVYNACTEALKAEQYPDRAMRQRIKLHDLFKDHVFKNFA